MSSLRISFMLAALLIIVLTSPATSQEELSLDQILERAYQTETVGEEQIEDYVCQATFMMREPQKDGTAKTVLIEDKTVYFKSPDREREMFHAVTKDGKVLSPEEVAEHQRKADEQAAKEAKKDDDKSASFSFSAKSPWSPEEKPNYNFELLPPETIRGIPTHVVRVKPKKRSEHLIDGRAWLHQGLFKVIKMDFQPSKNPKFVKKAHMIMDFDEVQPEIWLPVEMKIDASGGILFFKKSFQMHQTWRDYQINVGLSDSLFVGKD
jgi:outer membrane lipoprotein-sorting protein